MKNKITLVLDKFFDVMLDTPFKKLVRHAEKKRTTLSFLFVGLFMILVSIAISIVIITIFLSIFRMVVYLGITIVNMLELKATLAIIVSGLTPPTLAIIIVILFLFVVYFIGKMSIMDKENVKSQHKQRNKRGNKKEEGR